MDPRDHANRLQQNSYPGFPGGFPFPYGGFLNANPPMRFCDLANDGVGFLSPAPAFQNSSTTSPGATEYAAEGSSKGKRKTKVRLEWSKAETLILIDSWKEDYHNLRGASNVGKGQIWASIHKKYVEACKAEGIACDKSPDQAKKRLKNLEYEFKSLLIKMKTTGEEGANRIKQNFIYFDELNEVLGVRDAVNPERMNLMATNLVPSSPASSDTTASSTESPPLNDSRQDQGEETGAENAKRPCAAAASRKKPKRRRIQPLEEEDPHLASVCNLWKEAMAKQEERFNRAMQLQEAAISAQTEQTKLLVDGLKDVLKDCMKN